MANCGIDVLQKRPSTPTLKKHVISYMDTQTGTFEYIRGERLHTIIQPDKSRLYLGVLRKLDIQTRAEVERLGGNAPLMKFIDSLKID